MPTRGRHAIPKTPWGVVVAPTLAATPGARTRTSMPARSARSATALAATDASAPTKTSMSGTRWSSAAEMTRGPSHTNTPSVSRASRSRNSDRNRRTSA